MTSIPGNDDNSAGSVVIDSDTIIGLIHNDDALHERCTKILKFLKVNNSDIFAPYAIILEAATTLAKDKMVKRPDLAAKLLKIYKNLGSPLEGKNEQTLTGDIYNPKTSKKNSPFDFYVLACARANNIKTVFSFDSFYKKNGLILAEALL
ncbi:MAG: hypothetical protein A2782_04630 [Candidatus Blackburnbacteria bacterium RIFCSPHIGHO2_01_FULL_43_15b]|uniref:PIN domain-containing protein n=1 Tax=Candidatus Blackburnbacteria bacterium RIFCSPHIGHO2_01_FULL_43_15b TaxID=1797513 RepID=A0A1G1V3L1_9BACT|nr:MAG: hypothetical protein A2782_04630 [Candidatus Blackburnbacteria bacterium RIFCSPHIGHO2_01_FULL_43_15b]